MPKAAGNLQDSFLNQLRKENVEVTFNFVSGASLRGTVRGFDNFTIIIKDAEGHHHLVYKHAVAHVSCPKAIAFRQHANSPAKTTAETSGKDASDSKDSENKGIDQKGKSKEPFNRIDLSQLKVSK